MTGLLSIGIAAAAGPEVAEQLAPAAERAGLHALWVNDTPGNDALEVLAAAAQATERLVLATGVIPVDRRGADEIRARVAELGLIKVSREGTTAYALPPRLIEAETSGEDRLRKLLSDLPLEIHEAGLLLVLRTLPGSAHAIAAALDRARWPEVAGSIAGVERLKT